MTTVYDRLNYVPYRAVEVPFEIWFRHYKDHILNIFAFFKESLYNVYPFSEKNLDSERSLRKFGEMVYKNSSGVIK
jgi:hypothetical protein